MSHTTSNTRITVTRSRWLNGANNGTRKMYLYHPKSRYMDVLGHYLAGMGIRKADLYLKSSVEDAVTLARDVGVAWMGTRDKPSPIVRFIKAINEADTLSNDVREQVLTEAFATVGVQLDFMG